MPKLLLLLLGALFFTSCHHTIIYDSGVLYKRMGMEWRIEQYHNLITLNITRNHRFPKRELRLLDKGVFETLFYLKTKKNSDNVLPIQLDSVRYLAINEYESHLACMDLPTFPNLESIEYSALTSSFVSKPITFSKYSKRLKKRAHSIHIKTWLNFFERHHKLVNIIFFNSMHEEVLKEILSEKYAHRWQELSILVVEQNSDYDPYKDIARYQHQLKSFYIDGFERDYSASLDSGFLQLQQLESISFTDIVDSLSYTYLAKLPILTELSVGINSKIASKSEDVLRYLSQIRRLKKLFFGVGEGYFSFLPIELSQLSDLESISLSGKFRNDTSTVAVLGQLKKIKQAFFYSLDICENPLFAKIFQKMNSENVLEELRLRCDCWEKLDSSLVQDLYAIMPYRKIENMDNYEPDRRKITIYGNSLLKEETIAKIKAWSPPRRLLDLKGIAPNTH